MHPEIVQTHSDCHCADGPGADRGSGDTSIPPSFSYAISAAVDRGRVVDPLVVDDAYGRHPRPFGLQPLTVAGSMVFGTPVVLWVGWPILRKFWSRSRTLINMYTLIAGVGSSCSASPPFSFRPVPQEFRGDGAVGPISRRQR